MKILNVVTDIPECANGLKATIGVNGKQNVTPACDDSEYTIGYKCISCKDTWKDSECVVKHIINGRMLYFCLNCDDLVTRKSEVMQEGWTLLDGEGYLRRDI